MKWRPEIPLSVNNVVCMRRQKAQNHRIKIEEEGEELSNLYTQEEIEKVDLFLKNNADN